MANFKTHINVGIITTSILILVTPFIYKISQKDLINLNFSLNWNLTTLIIMFLIGTLASLLPDIDLKHSKISQYFTKSLYFLFPIIFLHYSNSNEYVLSYFHKITDIKLFYFFILLFIGVLSAYILNFFFFKLMKHRGLVHSIPFTIFLTILTFELFNIISNYIEINTYLISFSFFIGYVTHLTLDEIYSVDLKNRRLKNSFGSALSLFKYKNMFGTLFLYSFIFFYFKELLI